MLYAYVIFKYFSKIFKKVFKINLNSIYVDKNDTIKILFS